MLPFIFHEPDRSAFFWHSLVGHPTFSSSRRVVSSPSHLDTIDFLPGGDYTKKVLPELRASGWGGFYACCSFSGINRTPDEIFVPPWEKLEIARCQKQFSLLLSLCKEPPCRFPPNLKTPEQLSVLGPFWWPAPWKFTLFVFSPYFSFIYLVPENEWDFFVSKNAACSWIDAASTKRMDADSVIILDPVNRDVIDKVF